MSDSDCRDAEDVGPCRLEESVRQLAIGLRLIQSNHHGKLAFNSFGNELYVSAALPNGEVSPLKLDAWAAEGLKKHGWNLLVSGEWLKSLSS